MTPPRCCARTCAASAVLLMVGLRPTMSSCPARCDGDMAAASRWPQVWEGRLVVVVVRVGGRVAVVVAAVLEEVEVLGVGAALVAVGAVGVTGEPSEQPVATRAATTRTPRARRGRRARSLTTRTYPAGPAPTASRSPTGRGGGRT